MEEFKTPTTKKCRSRLTNDTESHTPLKIPASPFLKQIGYGCGSKILMLERSPKVGFLRSPWAIKKRMETESRYSDRIKFEAKILRKLNHPNIVGFRRFVEEPNEGPYLAMEKLDLSLGDAIEERVENEGDPYPANQILYIGYEVAKGLEYLHHTAHILHGDLKSYNILVSKDMRVVKLCDFGVSIPLNQDLEIDTSKDDVRYIGTECWNAPEIIFEEGPITNKTDIWAYGLVLWEMIALSPPHLEVADESMIESSFDDSKSENNGTKSKENIDTDDSMGENMSFLADLNRDNYGTRPPLPAIDLDPEYAQVLELFYACTDADYKSRPSAKGLIMFFEKWVIPNRKL